MTMRLDLDLRLLRSYESLFPVQVIFGRFISIRVVIGSKAHLAMPTYWS